MVEYMLCLKLFRGGYISLANIKSAKKRIKVIAAKTLQNKMVKTSLKTAIKKYETAVKDGDKANINILYRKCIKRIDQACAKGIIHKNNAARKKSSMTKKLNAVLAA